MSKPLDGRDDGFTRLVFDGAVVQIGAAFHAQIALWVLVSWFVSPPYIKASGSADWAGWSDRVSLADVDLTLSTLVWFAAALVALGAAVSRSRTATMVALAVAMVACAVHAFVQDNHAWDPSTYTPIAEYFGLAFAAIAFVGLALPASGLAGSDGSQPAGSDARRPGRSSIAVAALFAGLFGPFGWWLGDAAKARIKTTGEKGRFVASVAVALGVLWTVATIIFAVLGRAGFFEAPVE